MTETALMGNLAIRSYMLGKKDERGRMEFYARKKLLWDGENMRITNLEEANQFVGRQYRLTIANEHYLVDLVFYHRFLRCFVLIDLKMDKIKHYDIGQMNMYLGYFAKEEYFEGDKPPIGIVLTRQKDELLVEFATYGMSSQLFVSEYQLYLPNEEELRRELEQILLKEGDVDK